MQLQNSDGGHITCCHVTPSIAVTSVGMHVNDHLYSTINNSMESTLREYKSPRKRFGRQPLATLATFTILRPASFEFPDGAIS